MHLQKLSLRNIRSIESFDLELGSDELAGWHVLLGDNGAGKSSVIRSIALPLIGGLEAQALRQDWSNWLRHGQDSGSIHAEIVSHPSDTWLAGGKRGKEPIALDVAFRRAVTTTRPSVSVDFSGKPGKSANRTVWGKTSGGWFSASFGPFRRFSGGDLNYDKLFFSNPKAAAHLSAFGEDVALSEALRWLQRLHIRSLEGGGGEGRVKDAIVSFINGSQLLPHGARIADVTSDSVRIVDGESNEVAVEQMSDGYRSVLSLTFELLRQMFLVHDEAFVLERLDTSTGAVNIPGVVAIDEIDAHLHPAWQKRIGNWFVERFPQVQFFVTTHSPIICQAAVRGSIWRLPTPGVLEDPRRIQGDDLNKLLYGSILDAYGTQFFGVGVTRSESSKEKLLELAKLNRKSLNTTLSKSEKKDLTQLRAALPSTAAKVAAEE